MVTSPVLLLHICGAVVGLLSGFLSMAFRKGSGLHRAAGSVFFVSMLIMSSTAAYVAAFERPNKANLIVGLLIFYLVITAWWAARRKDGTVGNVDKIAFFYVLAVGLAGWTYGLEAANSASGKKDHMPAAIYFVFGSIALLCAVTDLRMLKRGNLFGPQRIARHLWRMCLALLITTMSFYPGQAKFLPQWFRQTSIVYVPHLFLIGSMTFWFFRVRRRRVTMRSRPEPATPQTWLPSAAPSVHDARH